MFPTGTLQDKSVSNERPLEIDTTMLSDCCKDSTGFYLDSSPRTSLPFPRVCFSPPQTQLILSTLLITSAVPLCLQERYYRSSEFGF